MNKTDALCIKMSSLSRAMPTVGMESPSKVTNQTSSLVTLSTNGVNSDSHLTSQISSSLAQRRKSRIPRPMSSVPNAKSTLVPKPTAVSVLPVPKPEATSTPTKVVCRKDETQQQRRARYLSDARKVKRMVTGVAPLDAAVDCASAPEWKKRSPSSPEVKPTCVPRPKDLRITRRVGVDGAVIAWAPLDHDCLAGFQVLVGGRVIQQVRSPHRTKALVTGLSLAGSITIGLVAVATDGRSSAPVIVTYDRSKIYRTKKSPDSLPENCLRPARRVVSTCL